MVSDELISQTDMLTGLVNRSGFNRVSQTLVNVLRKSKLSSTLILLDINDFNSINDRYGFAQGDDALRTFAKCINWVFPVTDLMARVGEDEFCVLLTNSDVHKAEEYLSMLDQIISLENDKPETEYSLKYRMSMVEVPVEGDIQLDEILAEAERKLSSARVRISKSESALA